MAPPSDGGGAGGGAAAVAYDSCADACDANAPVALRSKAGLVVAVAVIAASGAGL